MIRQLLHHNVILVIDIASGVSARNTLSGVFDYLNEGHAWTIQIVNPTAEFTPDMVRHVQAGGCSGMIVTDQGKTPDALETLFRTKIPVVLIDVKNKQARTRPNTISIFNDNIAVARLAFQHLYELGTSQSFAFVPSIEPTPWSDTREKAFRQLVQSHKTYCHVFSAGNALNPSQDHKNLCTWLVNLPKPAAVYVSWDFRAAQVVSACHDCELSIPEQVAIIGTDNDELFCHCSQPTLTSVSQNMTRSGYLAAAEMNALLTRSSTIAPKTITVPPKSIVQRESTHYIHAGVALVRRAMNYIESHVDWPLSVGDVVKHVGTSRRLLERRFQETRKTSIRRAIANARLGKINRLIRGTSRSFSKIASECGFKSLSSLSHFYRLATGKSLKAARNSAKTTAPASDRDKSA